MAINYFAGWSVTDLETELRAAQEDLARGSALIASGSADVSVQSSVQLHARERIQVLLAALNRADPERYPKDDVVPIKIVRPDFASIYNE